MSSALGEIGGYIQLIRYGDNAALTPNLANGQKMVTKKKLVSFMNTG